MEKDKYMYYVVEYHVDVKTNKAGSAIHHLDEFFPSLFGSYEAAKAYIEKRLVPHSIELRRESGYYVDDDRIYVDGTETWRVFSNEYYHVFYEIRKAKVAPE